MLWMQVFRARYVVPMCAPMIADGCVIVCDGKVARVGAYRDIKPDHVDHQINGVLMPGLINAHTHLELTNVPRPALPGSFVDWVLTISQSFSSQKEGSSDPIGHAVRDGLRQCLRFGVTCVGDISQNIPIVRPILRDAAIRSVSFGEVLGLNDLDRVTRLENEAFGVPGSEVCVKGYSPHAPYTVDARTLKRGDELSKIHDCRRCMHLAETPDEGAFLNDQSGSLGELYQRIGKNPGQAQGFDKGPIAWIASAVDLSGWLLAHVNYIADKQIAMLARQQARVVWCPRTHQYFNHTPHSWRQMRDAGIAVCVATDSCASSCDLNLVDDLRLIHQQHPDLSPETIWSLATTEAEKCLRWGGDESAAKPVIGQLSEGSYPDMIAFATRSDQPLTEILDTPAMLPSDVWINGIKV